MTGDGRPLRRWSMKRELMLGALALVLLIVFVQFLLQSLTLRDELARRISDHQFAQVSEIARQLDASLMERLQALERTGAELPIRALGDEEALERFLRAQRALLGLVDDLYIFDGKGRLLVDWPRKPGRRGLDMSGRDYLRNAVEQRRPVISQPVLGRATRQPIVVLAVPVFDGEGAVVAVLGGVLNLLQPNLLGTLTTRRIGDSGYFYLVSAQRTMIAHPDRSRIMEQMAPETGNRPLERAFAGFEGTEEGVNTRGLRGLFTFKRLSSTDWILASVVPADEAFRPIGEVQQRLAWVALALVVALLPLLWLFAHRQTRPLRRLAETLNQRAQAIRSGQAVDRVEVGGNQEMRTVGRAFNAFLEALNQAEGRQRMAARVFETAAEAIMVTAPDGTIIAVNPAFCRITGYSEGEVIGRTTRLLSSGRHDRAFFEAMWRALTTTGEWSGEIWNRRKNGEVFPEWQSISRVTDEAGRASGFVCVFTDLSAIRRAEAKAERLATRDPLTGLINRAHFLERIQHALDSARQSARHADILVLDLDRFKTINEARGLTLGDALLCQVASRLRDALGPDEVLARLAADEFAIMLPRAVSGRETAAREALALAERLRHLLADDIQVDGEHFPLTASIGIALFPEFADEIAADVLRQAETAVSRARAEGGDRAIFFEATMGEMVRQRFRIERELRLATGGEELRLFLQDQVDARGQRVGAEALVRWAHPEHGLLPPSVFVPLAENSDLIITIDRWMLAEVCRLLARASALGHRPRIAVNISPRHFRRPDFVDELALLLASSGARPTQLILEITEGIVIDDIADAVHKMETLHAMGVRFSMDDFGTGYSSLAYLKQLPIHELKIDRSFIQDIHRDPGDAMLVRTILTVARQMGLEVVAEGVETEAQAAFLAQHGEVTLQGYLYGRPEPAETWLARLAAEPVPAACLAEDSGTPLR